MASILEGIDSPEHVRKLSLPELEQLAAEIRERLITVLSNNGGHLGPNLGVVELTIALHYVFHTPSDSFLFDVRHQAYVHKLLTGRRERFHTIRTPGGLNGFMLRTESPHDCYGAGHAGTALSAALGMAVARDKTGGKEHIVAVAGDAAFTCGITYEALNNIAHHTKRLIVVLNDNEWSIDKNVGAIATYLNKIVTSPQFDYLHDRAGKLVEKVGGVAALRMARKAEEVAKGMLLPSVIFEELGLKYFVPIDGHDTARLIKTAATGIPVPSGRSPSWKTRGTLNSAMPKAACSPRPTTLRTMRRNSTPSCRSPSSGAPPTIPAVSPRCSRWRRAKSYSAAAKASRGSTSAARRSSSGPTTPTAWRPAVCTSRFPSS